MSDSECKRAVTVSSLCRQLQISRTNFYWHVDRGTFPPPLRLTVNGRPYYTPEMVEIIFKVKQTGVGFNGEVVLFNERLPKSEKVTRPSLPDTGQVASLCESLKHLGLQAKADELKAALASLFPDGQLPGEEQLLRQVYRHFRQQSVSVS